MPKGNVVLTKKKYRDLKNAFQSEFGESMGDKILVVMKNITDFDEESYTYNRENYKIAYEKKKNFNKDFLLHEFLYKKQLQNETNNTLNSILSS